MNPGILNSGYRPPPMPYGLPDARRTLATTYPARWTPAAIDGLQAWYDALDASTFTFNGSTVSQWRDKSVFARHLSQSTAANQPNYLSAGVNGRPAVQFVQSSLTRLEGTPFTLSQQTMFFAMALPSGGNNLWTNATSAAATQVVVGIISGAYKLFTVAFGSSHLLNVNPSIGSNSITSASPFVVSFSYNGAGGTDPANARLRRSMIDVRSEGSGFIGAPGSVSCRLGGTGANTSTYTNAIVSGVVVYNRILSATEISLVEGWLTASYGI